MIRFTARLLLKNKVLWAWPILITIIAVAMAVWGIIEPAPNGSSFVIGLNVKIPGSVFVMQLVSLITLISIIGLPTHFSKNIEADRAALILSKPISRTDLFLSDYAAMLVVSLFYTFITIVILAVLVGFEAGVLPVQMFLTFLIFLPLYLLGFYIAILFFLIITNSYLGSVLLGYILIPLLSSLFLNAENVLGFIGFSSATMQTILDFFSYLIPSVSGMERIMQTAIAQGFSAIDGGFFTFVLASFLPFFLAGWYIMERKQF